MPAMDALHAKALAHDDLFTEGWRSFAINFTASLRGEAEKTNGYVGYTESADDFTRRTARVLNLAHTFYVSPDMTALVTAAAESWMEDEPIHIEDFPTQQGWLYIPGGITTIDVRGRAIRTCAFSWTVVGGGVDLILWVDKAHDPMLLRDHPAYGPLPKYTPWHLGRITFEEPLPQSLRMGTVLPPEIADGIRIDVNPDGSGSMFIPEGWSKDQVQPRVGVNVELAWLVSALRIMRQPLATHEQIGVPANLRKRISGRRRPPKMLAVTVIDFRRREAGDGPRTPSGREYTHRWLRRGHWKRVWCGTERDGTRRAEARWFHVQHMLSDRTDLPLVLKEHINALIR